MNRKYILPILLLFFLLSGCNSKEQVSDATATSSDVAVTADASPVTSADIASGDSSEPTSTNSTVSSTPALSAITPTTTANPASINVNKTSSSSQKSSSKPNTNQPSKQASKTSLQRPAQSQRADLMGEVQSISGNTITVKVIETPQIKGSRNNGTRPSPGSNNNAPPSSRPNSQDRQAKSQFTPKYTGETKSIKIPTTASISSFQRGDQGMKEIKMKTSDIKTGDVLSIWYLDKTAGTVSKISVRRIQ